MYWEFINKYTVFLFFFLMGGGGGGGGSEKNFCTAKASQSFSTKIIGILEKLTSENITKR